MPAMPTRQEVDAFLAQRGAKRADG
jgi:hypothetical protein